MEPRIGKDTLVRRTYKRKGAVSSDGKGNNSPRTGSGTQCRLALVLSSNRSGDAVKSYADYYDTTVARNIANTAVHLTLQQLRDNSSWREGIGGVSFNDGILSATLTDTSIGGSNYINIAATGEYNDHSKTIVVLVEAVGFVPNGVRGSITANSDVRTTRYVANRRQGTHNRPHIDPRQRDIRN